MKFCITPTQHKSPAKQAREPIGQLSLPNKVNPLNVSRWLRWSDDLPPSVLASRRHRLKPIQISCHAPAREALMPH